MTKDALIVFVKKPEAGKVKTRLAASIGNEQALDVYLKLLERTREITQPLAFDKFIYYSPEIIHDDLWDENEYFKARQEEGDLGQKMQAAFKECFAAGYRRVCIIGSDCYQLNTKILEQAFSQLHHHDVVVGPSTDGGYYLLGMEKMHAPLFANKTWSSERVLSDTIADFVAQRLSYYPLPQLTDVDRKEDLKTME